MRAISILLVVLILLLLTAAAWAVPSAEISVPKEGAYYYWFTFTDVSGNSVETTPKAMKDKTTSADLPMVKDAVPQCTLYVLDADAGNEAVIVIPAKTAKDVKYELSPSSFDHVRRVEIKLVSFSKKLPVAAALVKLTDSDNHSQTQVLDPSAGGVLQFTDVPTGTAKLSIQYGDGKDASQSVDISASRDTAILSVEVPITGDVETVAAAAEPTGGKSAEGSKEKAEPISGISWGSALIGLAILFGVLYGGYRLLKNRGASAQQLLQQVGVDIPDGQMGGGGTMPPAPQMDPGLCPYCGGKKDPVTGACACSLGGAVPQAGASGGPRLIATQGSYMGNIYPIQSDIVTLGREESNNIALPQDATASRRHARIVKSGSEFKIHDEGSSNGTFVNGMQVTEQVLCPGDEIQIGSTRLRFEI